MLLMVENANLRILWCRYYKSDVNIDFSKYSKIVHPKIANIIGTIHIRPKIKRKLRYQPYTYINYAECSLLWITHHINTLVNTEAIWNCFVRALENYFSASICNHKNGQCYLLYAKDKCIYAIIRGCTISRRYHSGREYEHHILQQALYTSRTCRYTHIYDINVLTVQECCCCCAASCHCTCIEMFNAFKRNSTCNVVEIFFHRFFEHK